MSESLEVSILKLLFKYHVIAQAEPLMGRRLRTHVHLDLLYPTVQESVQCSARTHPHSSALYCDASVEYVITGSIQHLGSLPLVQKSQDFFSQLC